MGRVCISSVGNGLPFARGSTSSRLTGIPRAIKCCRRIRERVQFEGFVGGACINVLYMSRLGKDR